MTCHSPFISVSSRPPTIEVQSGETAVAMKGQSGWYIYKSASKYYGPLIMNFQERHFGLLAVWGSGTGFGGAQY